MDSLISISKPMAQGMAKSGTDFYAFLLLVLILGGTAMVMYFRYKSLQLEAQAKKDKEDSCEGGCPELTGFEKILDSRLSSMERMIFSRISAVEKRMDTNEVREEARFEQLNVKMDAGFRALHERIDIHIDKHQGA